MALGGGIWLTQKKVLPGTYINYVSAARATANLSDRGYVAVPLEFDWGAENEIITIESSTFMKEAINLFGVNSTHDSLRPIREILKGAKTLYTYRLNSGGEKATATLDTLTATAKYSGLLGNSITIVITENEEDSLLFDVRTLVNNRLEDVQTAANAESLESNSYVVFEGTGTLTVTAGLALEGGTNGTVTEDSYTQFLTKVESYYINTLAYAGTDDTIKSLFVQHTKNMREDFGVKFQTVLYKKSDADYEGIISVENKATDEGVNEGSLVYWVVGKTAGCPINRSLTNMVYDGEYTIDVDYTQTELANAIKSGKFMFHRVGDQVRVLTDINTFVSFTPEKSKDFSINQIIRVLDQDAVDTAAVFNNRYLGKVQNNDSGRISLWNELVTLAREYQRLGAIENFEAEDITIEKGNDKKSVVVTKYLEPTSAMEKLYVTVIVE